MLVSKEAEEFLQREERSPRSLPAVKRRLDPELRAERSKQRGRADVGLRNITEQVHKMLKDKYPDTIEVKEIVSRLPNYRHCRRRVGDVLNVLHAADVVTSRKKEIRLVKSPKKKRRRGELQSKIRLTQHTLNDINDPL